MTTWYTPETFVIGTELKTVPANEAGDEHRTNRKLKRLSVDSADSNKRRSLTYEDSSPVDNKVDLIEPSPKGGTLNRLSRLYDGKSRYPRMEDMPHFHYDSVDLTTRIQVSLHEPSPNEGLEKRHYSDTEDIFSTFLVKVTCQGKSWVIRRTYANFIALDKQVHRCSYDRQFSNLQVLSEFKERNDHEKSKDVLKTYLNRLSDISDDVINCGPVLNWFELDNHGNHLLLTDESAINVPAIAAGHVIKRYNAQSSDEITLEVGDIISVIDMPPIDESLWWRGKKRYEVGFFPSQCVEVIGDKAARSPIPTASSTAHMKPVAKKRGKIISFLRSFLSSRPSRTRLIQSGILKERTFGGDLGEHLAHTAREVPLVLEKCCEVIEKHGIVDGVYRLSGMTSNIQKLRLAFDGETPPDLTRDCYLHDIHCISSLLKMYFRELPNPLLTYHLYDKFVAAIQIPDDEERRISVHHVVEQLPPPHYRTLEYLLMHLAKVAAMSSQTGMHSKNLAIVWAPNLLKAKGLESGGAALLEVRVQSIVVEYLIKNVHVFFDKDTASKAIISKPQYSTAMRHRLQIAMDDFKAEGGLGPRLASISVSPPPKLLSLEEARRRVASTPSRPPPPKPRLVEKYQSYPAKGADPKKEPPPVSPRRVSEGAISKKSFKGIFSKGKSFNAEQGYEATPSYYRSISSEGHCDWGSSQTQNQEPYQNHKRSKDQIEKQIQGQNQGPNQGPNQGQFQGTNQGQNQGQIQGKNQGQNRGHVQGQNQDQMRRESQDRVLQIEPGQLRSRDRLANDERPPKPKKGQALVVPSKGPTQYTSKVTSQFKIPHQMESWESRLNHVAMGRAMQAHNKNSRAFRQTRSYTAINRAVDEQPLQKSSPHSSSVHQVTRVHIRHVRQSPIDHTTEESSEIKLYIHKAAPSPQTNGTTDQNRVQAENKPRNSDSRPMSDPVSSAGSRTILGPASNSISNVVSVPVYKAESKPSFYRTFSDPSGSEQGDAKPSSSGSFSGRVTNAISVPASISSASRAVAPALPASSSAHVLVSRSNTVSGSGAGAMIRRHPVLHSFKRVSADHTVYYTKAKCHQAGDGSSAPKPKGLHRRASTGGQEDFEAYHRKTSAPPLTDYRPISVYDNRPMSVYDNEPSTFRYSSPVVRSFKSVPEERSSVRHSSPPTVNEAPPMPRWVESALYRTGTV